MRLLHEVGEIGGWLISDRRDSNPRGLSGLLAVSESVDHGDQGAVWTVLYEVQVSGYVLSRKRSSGYCPIDQGSWAGIHDPPTRSSHFFSLTVVPSPTRESISNSSIRRLAPGRPMPRL